MCNVLVLENGDQIDTAQELADWMGVEVHALPLNTRSYSVVMGNCCLCQVDMTRIPRIRVDAHDTMLWHVEAQPDAK